MTGSLLTRLCCGMLLPADGKPHHSAPRHHPHSPLLPGLLIPYRPSALVQCPQFFCDITATYIAKAFNHVRKSVMGRLTRAVGTCWGYHHSCDPIILVASLPYQQIPTATRTVPISWVQGVGLLPHRQPPLPSSPCYSLGYPGLASKIL